MITEPVLVDTGALIGLFNPHDSHHTTCVTVSKELPVGKVYTCWPVVTEAAYLLRAYPTQRNELLDAVYNGEFILLHLRREEIPKVKGVFTKYHDQDVDLADAILLLLAEREGIKAVFTTDRRHFSVFRLGNGNRLRLLPEID